MRDDSIAVIIPSINRAQTLHETLLSVLGQRRLPGQIVVSAPSDDDVLAETRALPGVTIIRSEIGSSRQRNSAIDALAPSVRLVAFLDDDVELHDAYLERMAELFDEKAQVVLADGHVLADGPSIPRQRAREIVAAAGPLEGQAVSAIGPEKAYGCNMVVRRAVLADTRFDERLLLYGYMEDRDFAFECARRGEVVRCETATLVHLRVAGGRVSVRRFGFSQVMNPLYLWRKGNYVSRSHVVWQVWRPLLINAAFALSPAQRGARLGLLAGNLRALATVLRGRIAPEDMVHL